MGGKIKPFCGYLIKTKKKSATIKSYISAIKAILHDIDVEVNEDRFLPNALTRACRLINDHVRLRFPIHKQLLLQLLNNIELSLDQQPFLKILYLVLFSAMYYGLFRVGELTFNNHAVKARDVHVGKNKKKMMFILRTSKTHWHDVKPQIIKISGHWKKEDVNAFDRFCPFQLLLNYTEVRGAFLDNNEQFFIFCDHSPVTPPICAQYYMSALRIEKKFYNTMSFRIGESGGSSKNRTLRGNN